MYCSECGNKLIDGAQFCTGCGASQGGKKNEKPTSIPNKSAFNSGLKQISGGVLFCCVLQMLALIISCVFPLIAGINPMGWSNDVFLFRGEIQQINPGALRWLAAIYVIMFIFLCVRCLLNASKPLFSTILQTVMFVILAIVYRLHIANIQWISVVEFRQGFYVTLMVLVAALIVAHFIGRQKQQTSE